MFTFEAIPQPNYITNFVLFNIISMFLNHHLGPFSALSNDIFDLSVNPRLHLFTIRFGVVDVRESNVAEVGVHAKLGNKMIG